LFYCSHDTLKYRNNNKNKTKHSITNKTTTNEQTLSLQGMSVDTEHDLSLSNSSYVLHGRSLV